MQLIVNKYDNLKIRVCVTVSLFALFENNSQCLMHSPLIDIFKISVEINIY